VGIPERVRVTVPDRVSDKLLVRLRDTVADIVGKLDG